MPNQSLQLLVLVWEHLTDELPRLVQDEIRVSDFVSHQELAVSDLLHQLIHNWLDYVRKKFVLFFDKVVIVIKFQQLVVQVISCNAHQHRNFRLALQICSQ